MSYWAAALAFCAFLPRTMLQNYQQTAAEIRRLLMLHLPKSLSCKHAQPQEICIAWTCCCVQHLLKALPLAVNRSALLCFLVSAGIHVVLTWHAWFAFVGIAPPRLAIPPLSTCLGKCGGTILTCVVPTGPCRCLLAARYLDNSHSPFSDCSYLHATVMHLHPNIMQ